MSNIIKASDCQCFQRGKPAVAFWPVFDPDIPSNPYCREHLDEAKLKLMIMIHGGGSVNLQGNGS